MRAGVPEGEAISVAIPGPLVRARFVARPNRFVLRVTLDDDKGGPAGEPVEAHMADPGRLEELLLPGAHLLLRPARKAARRTRWSAVLVEAPQGGWVSLDTTLPNRLVARALEAGALDELAGWQLVRREWTHGRSRFDFLLAHETGDRMALEVKSVTLVEDGVARFPDAVTARGARHVSELTDLAGRPGWQATVLFVLQRDDARRIHAAPDIDPVFAQALEDARAAGVRILGRRCRVAPAGVTLGAPVPAG